MLKRLLGLLMMAAAADCGSANAQALIADDLCNFPLEQLTLATGRSDLTAWAQQRGWKDISTPPATSRGRQTVETWSFEAPDDRQPRQINHVRKGVVLVLTNGKPTGLTIIDDEPPHIRDRARAFCAMLGDRFEVSGCDAQSHAGHTFNILAQPRTQVGDGYCQASFSTGRASVTTYQMAVGWHSGAPRALFRGLPH